MIAILSASLVLIAHNVFQVWLYMKPCEQCVYIRFAFLCMTFGCLFPIVFPKSLACRIISYVCGVYGCIYGIMCSLKLDSIHRAIHSDDLDAMFGMQGCSLEPHYPFGLPLEKWAPDWFLPTGDCGYDNSDVQHVQRRGRLVSHPLDEVHVDGAVLPLGLHRRASHLHRPLLGDDREAPHGRSEVTNQVLPLEKPLALTGGRFFVGASITPACGSCPTLRENPALLESAGSFTYGDA